jgi:hypothetical protein
MGAIKSKIEYLFVALIVLMLAASMALAATALQVKLDAPGSYKIVQDGIFNAIQMENFATTDSPGDPMLPHKIYDIVLPPDALMSTVKVNIISAQKRILDGTYDIKPAGPDVAQVGDKRVEVWGDKNIVDGKNVDVYQRNADFPASPVRLITCSQMRKWQFARVDFSPFQYNPVSKKLTVTESVEIEISYEKSPIVLDATLMSDKVQDDIAAKRFLNYSEAKDWYVPAIPPDRPSDTTYDYVIITTNAINAGSTKLANFVAHKQGLGFSVLVVTYEGSIAGLTGQAPNHRAEKIRKWLINNYSSMGIEYVLLIGNPTPYESGEGNIPMKMCYPIGHSNDDNQNQRAPTDYFYADLTGNWDFDGDQFYGEWSDDFGPAGGVDFAQEVYVGRIPVYSTDYTALDNILQKMIDYENESASSRTWRCKALLPMSYSEAGYDGGQLAEQMKDDYLDPTCYSSHRMYQQGNGPCGDNSGYTSEEELRGSPGAYPAGQDTVQNEWTNDSVYGIVCWWAHGSATSATVGYGATCWDGTLFQSGYCASLDDNYPAFTYQCSCNNGWPEVANNLQYAILKRGGVATVSATRVSWYNTTVTYGNFDGSTTNSGIGYEYVDRVVQNLGAGVALYNAKGSMVPEFNTRLMNWYDFNLYGDPDQSIDVNCVCSGPVVKWVQPPDSTYNGIDIRCDHRDGIQRTLADDFNCTRTGPITKITLWGSWRSDIKGKINRIHLSIHSDDPIGLGGSDPSNEYSKPDLLLWEMDFYATDINETLYKSEEPEWFWDPTNNTPPPLQYNHYQIWQYDIPIDSSNAFVQQGDPCNPVIYWLDAYVELEPDTNNPMFGWKTSTEQWHDDAVWWDATASVWNELSYPMEHPLYPESIDLSFKIITRTTEEPEGKPLQPHTKWSQPPIEINPASTVPRYCGWDEESFKQPTGTVVFPCWDIPRQCHGDADGLKQGTSKSGYWYVGTDDLAILNVAMGGVYPNPPYNHCADFDRDLDVDADDMTILNTWWEVKEPPDGPGVPPDCPLQGSGEDWRLVADDFRCLGTMPVTSIHWWGSYKGWEWLQNHGTLPSVLPSRWWIGFWSNVPAGAPPEYLNYSYPEVLLHSITIDASRVTSEEVGSDEYYGEYPLDICYQYNVDLRPEEFFWQDEFNDMTEDNIYWISIVAEYDVVDILYPWGWKTRPWHWMDDAVRFSLDVEPAPGHTLSSSQVIPIKDNVWQESVDVSFELDTDPNYIKWEQYYAGNDVWMDTALLGWWKFDEGSGTVAKDSSGNQRDGTVYGNPTWQTSGSPVGNSGYLEFDGLDDYVDVNYITRDAFLLPVYTVSMWFRIDGSDTDERNLISVTNSELNHGMLLSVNRDVVGTMRYLHRHPFLYAMGPPYENIYTTTTYNDGFWHHAVAVRASDNNRLLYVDGLQVGSEPNAITAFDAPMRVILGALFSSGYTQGGRWWNGAIDDVRIYNRALSAAEVTAIYNGSETHKWPHYEDVNSMFSIRNPQDERLVVDDWLCLRRTPVTAISWWGSYIGYGYEACSQGPFMPLPVPPDKFRLKMWTDVPAGNAVTIAAGSDNGYVYVYDGVGNLLWSYDTGADVASVDVSVDGKYIAVGSYQNKLYLFDRSGTLLWQKSALIEYSYGGGWMGEESKSVSMSAYGEYIVAACSNGLFVYNNDGTLHWSDSNKETCADISPDGNYIAACDESSSSLSFFSIASSTALWTKSSYTFWVATSNPGYVATSDGSSVYLFDSAGTQIWNYSMKSGYIRVDMPEDGLSVVAVNDDPGDSQGCELHYFNDLKDGTSGWAAADGTPVWTYDPGGSTSDFYSVAISGDGEYISTGPAGGSYVFSKSSNVPQQTLSMGTANAYDLTYDGQYGACGNRGGELYYFSKDSGTPLWNKTLGGIVHTVAVGLGSSFSHPGEVIWEYETSKYDEVLVGYDKHPEGEPNEPVFRYSIRLPEDKWFRQPNYNGIFWLSVQAVYDTNTPNYNWGWTNHKHVFNDDAVSGYYDDVGGKWVWTELYDQTDASEDMSFMLFTDPKVCSTCANYNCDAIVNFLDYADFADDWLCWAGAAGGYNNSDLNCDGSVDFRDLKIFVDQWLGSCP